MRSLLYTFSFITSLLFLLNGATASNVIELTPSNFDDIVGSGKPALVEFFAPWCGHCKNLAPIYEQLADVYNYAKDKVVVAKVDADAHRELGQRFGIKGFPTLKWFTGKASDPEDYNSGRDLDSLTGFIEQKSGVRPKVAKAEPSKVVVLTDKSFDSIVLDPSKDVFVEFYAPWCGHCKNLAPTWESLAKTFGNDKDVVIAKIDAEAEKRVAGTYGISSFPQLKFFPKGSNKEPINYDKARGEKDLTDFVNAQAGTHRAPGGALSDSAGRIPEFDELAQKLAAATTDSEEGDIHAQVEKLVKQNPSIDAKYYARVFAKVKEDPQYAMNEKHRLEAIIAKGTTASEKLDNFKVRMNILSAFGVSGRKREEL